MAKKPKKSAPNKELVNINNAPVAVRKFSNPSNLNAMNTIVPWWSYDENTLPSAVFASIKAYKNKWGLNYQDMLRDGYRYADKEYNYIYGQSPYIQTIPNEAISLNLTMSCIDTLVSKLCKNQPSIFYLTHGGDYLLQEEAIKLQKFIDGLFQFKKVPQTADITAKDTCIYGTGLVHVRMHNRKKEIVYDKTKPYELIFDWNAGANETLSDFHVIKFVNKYDLMREFPHYADIIYECPVQNDLLTVAAYNTDSIICVHSYSFYAERYSITIANKTLLDMEWFLKDMYDEPLFPLAVMRYEHADKSFFGVGASSKLKAVQRELNYCLRTAQTASRLGCVPKILCPRGADMQPSDLNNLNTGIWYYSGPTPPSSAPAITIPVQLFEQIDRFKDWGFEAIGMSQLSASGKNPLAPDASGKAIETMYSIESSRFAMLGKEYENLYIQLNDITLAYYEQLPEMAEKALVQTYFKRDESEIIRFSDINIRRDQCYIAAYPVSAMPETPAGQFEEVYRRLQAGLMDPQLAKKLLRMPDTEAFDDFETAEFDFVMQQISKMVRGEEQEPLDIQNPDFALLLVQKAFFYYSTQGLEQRNLGYIFDYINKVKLLLQAKFEEAQQYAAEQQQLAGIQQQSTPNFGGDAAGAAPGQPAQSAGGGAPTPFQGG